MTSVIDERRNAPRADGARQRREPLRRGGDVALTASRVPARADGSAVRPRMRASLSRTTSRATSRAQATARHWNSESVLLLGIGGLLTLIGLVFVLSASSVFSLSTTKSVWGVFLRQLQWEALGLVVLAASATLGFEYLRKGWAVLWGSAVVLLMLVRFTPLGVTRNGSVRWIGPSSFEIQPSELAKLAVVTALAHMLSLRHDFTDWRVAAKYLAPFVLIPVVLVGTQPDLGTTSVIAAAALAVMFAGNINGRWLGCITVGGALLAAFSLHLNEYQWARVTAFIDPQSAAAFHIRRSLAGIQAGGLFGVGIGASKSKWGFLPNAHTDFIFSVITEEVGLIGATVVVALFAAFAVLGVRIALRAPDRFSRLVAFGITGWIATQAFANIAAVTGLAPVTGVPLPFVSQGGTAFVSLMAAMGILLDIARRGTDRRRTKTPHPSMRRAADG